jgi:hypothetical protein
MPKLDLLGLRMHSAPRGWCPGLASNGRRGRSLRPASGRQGDLRPHKNWQERRDVPA